MSHVTQIHNRNGKDRGCSFFGNAKISPNTVVRPLFKSFRSAEAIKAKDVAVCCSVLQCFRSAEATKAKEEMLQCEEQLKAFYRLHNPEKYVRVLQFVAVQSDAVSRSVLQCVAVRCSVLRCIAKNS